jgi:hypothetical protein
VSQLLFPVESAENYLRDLAPSLERTAGALRWSSDDGTTELSLTPINEQTFDGLIVSEVVTLTHTSPFIADLPLDAFARLNSWATISSFVPADLPAPLGWLRRWGYSAPTGPPLSECMRPCCALRQQSAAGMLPA